MVLRRAREHGGQQTTLDAGCLDQTVLERLSGRSWHLHRQHCTLVEQPGAKSFVMAISSSLTVSSNALSNRLAQRQRIGLHSGRASVLSSYTRKRLSLRFPLRLRAQDAAMQQDSHSSNSSTLLPVDAGAPGLALLGLEPLRAAFEYVSMLMSNVVSPAGDGHAVVVFPGLALGERSTEPLRTFCQRGGYAALDWGRGVNQGPTGDIDDWLDELTKDVLDLTAAHERPITLVGWSLGGIYAREIAKKMRRRVRQVITIGTPFAGTPDQNNVGLLYRLVNGQKASMDNALRQRLARAPDVPTTSIYSRSDGIVAWQTCIQSPTHPRTESIEIDGSHCGLGWNPAVLSVIADRLAHTHGAWRPYA